MNEIEHAFYRGLVEQAGAIWVGFQPGFGITRDSILFQRVNGGSTIALFTSACRTVHDVELALKADREKFAQKVLA